MTQDARVKLPPAEPGRRKVPKIDWLEMDDAPRDGKPLWLKGPDTEKGEEQFCEALWRHTRKIDPKMGRWVETGFWALRNSGGRAVDWAPVGWTAAQ